MIAQEIFKAYDIRGIVDTTLTDDAVRQIAKAIASEAIALNVTDIALGRDGRLSGPHLAEILAQEMMACGINVLDIGAVTTPMLYFTAHTQTNGSGVMITGSHNPKDYNGFKIMLAGETFAGEKIQNLLHRIQQQNFIQKEVSGSLKIAEISDDYILRIAQDIRPKRPMHIAIDAGNGIAGAYAARLFKAIGCIVDELFCEVDGTFPNHHPDPAKPENLQDLIHHLQNSDAEIGLAFDGDGDRLGVVTKDGQIIYPDRQLMLFAADTLSRVPEATIIYDVKCTRLLKSTIQELGGKPFLSKTGHSFIKAAMKEHHAEIAGEMSGHLFFKERWYGFDDGMYAGCRLVEILSANENPSALLNALPNAISTPEINIKMEKEGQNHQIIQQLQDNASFPDAQEIIKIDGLRVEYADGFGLIRASNTTPVLVLRFEADNETALKRIQANFAQVLQQVNIRYSFS